MYKFLAYKKETNNKIRWDSKVERTPFELYIPKWRVPEPAPDVIMVKVGKVNDFPNKNIVTRENVERDHKLRDNPIYVELERDRDHTETIRYNPVGNEESWEIGKPYIPKAVLEKIGGNIEDIALLVEWR